MERRMSFLLQKQKQAIAMTNGGRRDNMDTAHVPPVPSTEH